MTAETGSFQRRRPLEGRGETSYVQDAIFRSSVTVLSCRHETTDGYSLRHPFRWFCWTCRRYREAT